MSSHQHDNNGVDTAEQPLMKAMVKAVTSGDTLVLVHPTKVPPLEKILTLAHIQAPRLAKRNETTEEPFAFAAREFIRKRCIGKMIMFRVLYKNKNIGRDYGAVFIQLPNGQIENLGVALLHEGLATLKGKNQEYDEYEEAQEHARNKGLNLWSSDEEFKKKNTRELKWTGFSSEKLLRMFKNKPLNVVVEHVLSGSSFRAVLPTGEMVILNLTGIMCPSIKYEDQQQSSAEDAPLTGAPTGERERVQVAQPYAKEALHLVESRLLHRDVIVLFEGVDKHGNFIGTVLKSKTAKSNDPGPITFQEELLSRGYARIADWSIGHATYLSRLRIAEQGAKKQHLKIWKDGDASLEQSSLTEEDKSVIRARVIEVLSGDTLRVRNMKTNEEDRISLSSIRCPRLVSGPRGSGAEPEPWSRESREFLRSKVAGKLLHITVDYRKTMGQGKKMDGEEAATADRAGAVPAEERRFCTVLVEGNKNDISTALVSAGLATVIRHGQNDERSSNYFQLLAAEKEALSRHVGVHGTKPPPPQPSNDLTSQNAVSSAQKYFMLLKDKRCKAIVEKVYNGSRFKLYLPKEYFVVNFNISGIMCPSLGPKNDPSKEKPLARAAQIFSQNILAVRDIEVVFESLDKTGSFVGHLFVGNENFGVTLLREGLALTSTFAQKLKNWPELQEAEKQATVEKKNIWGLEDPSVVRRDRRQQEIEEDGEDQLDEDEEDYSSTQQQGHVDPTATVRVTDVSPDGSCFYYQTPESATYLQQVDQLMAKLSLDSTSPTQHQYTTGQMCFAKYSMDNTWYRARILSSDSKTKTATVFFADFGNTEQDQPWSQLRPLHSSVDPKAVPFQAKEGRLAFVALHRDRYRDQVSSLLLDLVDGRDLQAHHEHTIGRRKYYTLVDPTDGTNINAQIIREGLAAFVKPASAVAQNYSLLQDAQRAAKAEHIGLWEHGDVFGDDSFAL